MRKFAGVYSPLTTNSECTPHPTLLWIGKQYADLGFFADAAEALGELCSRFNDPDARRLLAEVMWWRAHAHHIPWIPPAGEGARYNRMMQFIDPSARTAAEEVRHTRLAHQQERIAPYRPSLDPQLARLLRAALPEDSAPATASQVAWRFLDEDDGQPGEPADWVKKQIRRMEKWEGDELRQEMLDDMRRQHQWTRNIPPPATPPKYDPNEPPFDPREFFGALGDEEEWDEEDE